MKIVFATHNEGKIKEMRAILNGLPIEFLTVEEMGVHKEVEEDGATFEENALKKAGYVSRATGEWAVADDSGICIHALGNAPGVFSARWAGDGATERDILRHTLFMMRSVPESERSASLESAIALVTSDGKGRIFAGKIRGFLLQKPRGTMRVKLPYDMIFVPEGHTHTFAEMSDEEKNALSARGQALKKFREFLMTIT